jgi:uncharacterized protein
MLSPRPWTVDAVVRLLLGVITCLCLGSVITSIWYYAGPGGARHIAFLAMAGAGLILLGTAIVLISQRWTLESLVRRLLLMLVCLSAGLSLAMWTQKTAGKPPEGSFGEQMVVAEAAVLFFFIGFMRAQGLSWSEAFGLATRPRQAILSGLAVACIFLPLAEGLQWASTQAMTQVRMEPQEQQAVHALRVSSTWSNRLSLALLALLLAPLLEEIFFRGILYPAIKQAGFPRLAFWGVSIAFACVHFNVSTFIPLLVLALLLTLLYERTDNLLAPISAHALFNGLNFALLYLFERQLGK